jgi:hypothetical protein
MNNYYNLVPSIFIEKIQPTHRGKKISKSYAIKIIVIIEIDFGVRLFATFMLSLTAVL